MHQKDFSRFALLGMMSAILLSGCGSDEKKPKEAPSDAALSSAVGDRMMVDPDLSGEQGTVIAPNSGQITIPEQERTPEGIAAAKEQALKLAGGAYQPLPQATPAGSGALAQSVATAAQVAGKSQVGSPDCASKVAYSNTWAAELPAELPVYPRGAVQEAAGINGQGCALRVVNFATPVGVDDVINFYYTRAQTAGYATQYTREGKDYVLGGRKGAKAYVVYTRTLDNGLTEVDIVTGGV